jgi:hypothetical protein
MPTPFRRWWKEKPLRMIWRVCKEGCTCYLIGTAHFFPYSFAPSITHLLKEVQAAIFEGPLDPDSMQQIAAHGRSAAGSPGLDALLDPQAIQEIDRLLRARLDSDPASEFYRLLLPTRADYFEQFTRGVRPWMALFSIWTTYLDWEYSVDMQAYQIACRLGKTVHFLESVAEQLGVLDSIPLERILRHLNDVHNWGTYKDDFTRTYLEGRVERLLSLTDRFPSRCPPVIGLRDETLFQRMNAIFEQQSAAAFVGVPHVPGIRRLLQDCGYSVEQELR